MIPNSKYEDKAFMISELCEMFKADELVQLADLALFCPLHMSPEEFNHKYMKHLKFFYLEHLPAIQRGTYQKIPFQNLNRQIVEAVNGNARGEEYELKPNTDKEDGHLSDSRKNKDKIQSVIGHIRNRQK